VEHRKRLFKIRHFRKRLRAREIKGDLEIIFEDL
jgi:Spy/CpxP family protein refolding chaperone